MRTCSSPEALLLAALYFLFSIFLPPFFQSFAGVLLPSLPLYRWFLISTPWETCYQLGDLLQYIFKLGEPVRSFLVCLLFFQSDFFKSPEKPTLNLRETNLVVLKIFDFSFLILTKILVFVKRLFISPNRSFPSPFFSVTFLQMFSPSTTSWNSYLHLRSRHVFVFLLAQSYCEYDWGRELFWFSRILTVFPIFFLWLQVNDMLQYVVPTRSSTKSNGNHNVIYSTCRIMLNKCPNEEFS